MALPASGWKYVSSSGATNPLGCPRHPDRGRRARSVARAGSRIERRPGAACARASARAADVLDDSVSFHRWKRVPSWRALVAIAARASLRGSYDPLYQRHGVMQGYPLNLSISLSGGEENNRDAPSNGE